MILSHRTTPNGLICLALYLLTHSFSFLRTIFLFVCFECSLFFFNLSFDMHKIVLTLTSSACVCVCLFFFFALAWNQKSCHSVCCCWCVCSFLLRTFYPRKQILAKVRKTVEDGTKEEELLRKKKTKRV